MKPEVKKSWVEALRSGEYGQGKNLLKDETDTGNPQYCCLGVLCEIVPPSVGQFNRDNDGVFSWEDSVARGLSHSRVTLSDGVVAWAGLPLEVRGRPVLGTLMGMNDCELRSFDEIADWIEENL